jgi:hypothetical protein
VLITDFVIPEEELLELTGSQLVKIILNPSVHLLPEGRILAVELLHEVVHAEVVLVLDAVEVVADVVKSLRHPRVCVPVMRLLPLNLREVSQAFDHLVVLQELDPLEAEQDLIGSESIPVDLGGVIQEDLFALGGVPLMAHPHGDGDGEGDLRAGLQVRRTDEELAVVRVQLPVVETYARLEASDLLWRTEAEAVLDRRKESARERSQTLQFYH